MVQDLKFQRKSVVGRKKIQLDTEEDEKGNQLCYPTTLYSARYIAVPTSPLGSHSHTAQCLV